MDKQSRLNSWLGLSLFLMVILSNSVNSRSIVLKVDDDNNKYLSGNMNYFTTGESKNSKGEHKNICFGDSGGPLVHQDPQTQRWTIIGTAYAVFSDNCQGRAAWNKVAAHLDWINDVLDGDPAKESIFKTF